MRLRTTHRLLSLLLPAALLITSCSGAAPSSETGSAETSAVISATEEAAGSMSAEAEIETPDSGDADISALVSNQAVTTSESQETTAVGSTSAGTENADALSNQPNLPAPYTMESYDTVPEEFQEWHDDIDYGTVEADVEYYSNTAGDYKYCNVLLPAGYDASQEYPVLYMFHGFGGRYDSHVHEGSILQTLYGKMLHDGLAVPMIIVGADMYTGPLAEKDGMSDEEMRPYYDKGIDDLVQDLMPFIESRYSVKKGRQYTAVTGVSQGGTDALAAGFKWQAKIGYIGSFAPCTGVIPTPYYRGTFWNTPILDDFVIESPETMPIYIYQLVGSEDPWCIDSTLYYGKVMDQKGIPNQTDLVEGYDHGNDLWRLGHYNFMQKIFLN